MTQPMNSKADKPARTRAPCPPNRELRSELVFIVMLHFLIPVNRGNASLHSRRTASCRLRRRESVGQRIARPLWPIWAPGSKCTAGETGYSDCDDCSGEGITTIVADQTCGSIDESASPSLAGTRKAR